MTRQDEPSPGQPEVPVDLLEPGREPADLSHGTAPRFEEIFLPIPLPQSGLHPEEPPPSAPSAGRSTPAAASGEMPIDDDNPLGVVAERPRGGRRESDAASSFEDLMSQVFVEKPDPDQKLDFEVERRQLWPWVVVVLVLAGIAVAGFVYRDRIGSLLGAGSGVPVGAASEPPPEVAVPTPEMAVPTPEAVPTPVVVPTEPVAVEPSPSPMPTPAPALVDPASLPAATRIQVARWEPTGEGGFVVLEANGGVVPRRIRHQRLDNPPRELVRITGISSPSEPDSVAVGGALVARIRLGYHPELSPPELYVVVDLGSPTAQAGEVQVSGHTVRIPFR